MSNLGREFVHFVAECLSLPVDTFDEFLGEMSRLKFVKYPPSAPGSQGVGPHKDSIGLFTFLAQDDVGGLQVLNKSGEWIDAVPIPGSLVVNVAQGFEAITGGVCSGTTHRVLVSDLC
jgi:isopenicillin N synthase-like dioxygenase